MRRAKFRCALFFSTLLESSSESVTPVLWQETEQPHLKLHGDKDALTKDTAGFTEDQREDRKIFTFFHDTEARMQKKRV